MILSAQTIRELSDPSPFLRGLDPMIEPFHERTVQNGMTFGLGPAGYDIRIKQTIRLLPEGFMLASAIEYFRIPRNVMAFVYDKSSFARKGLSLFNTCLEPGWEGFLTLELKNQGDEILEICEGAPIAQVVFHQLDKPTMQPYQGKYQLQADEPVAAIHEGFERANV